MSEIIVYFLYSGQSRYGPLRSSLDGGLDVQEYNILSYPHYKTCEFHLAYGPPLDGNLYKNLYTQGMIKIIFSALMLSDFLFILRLFSIIYCNVIQNIL